MGILEQYEKQFPETNKPTPQWQPASEYGFFVKLVMKLSGGRIRDERGANYVLIVAAGIAIVISTFLLRQTFGTSIDITKKVIPGEENMLQHQTR